MPARDGETVREAFLRMAARILRILAGEQVFRPLHVEDDIDPVTGAAPSVYRGGSTFVFDLEALRDVPNLAPDVGSCELRRSDMVWALLNARYIGRRVVRAELPVAHDRGHLTADRLDLDALIKDTQGHALYSALRDHLDRRSQEASGQSALELDEADLSFAVEQFQRHAEQRVEAYMLSFHRTRGLLKSIQRALSCVPAWWRDDAQGRRAAEQLSAFVAKLMTEYQPERLAAFREAVLSVDQM